MNWRFLTVALGVWLATGCKNAAPPSPADAAVGAQPPIAKSPAPTGAVKTSAAVGAASAPVEAEPYALPAGQTLGDALPPLPAPAAVLGGGGGGGGALLQAKTGCAADAADDFTLAKRLEVAFAPAKAGEPAQVLETCLLQKTGDRQDKVADTGKAFTVVAAFADDSRVAHTFEPLARPPQTLPAERRKAGHEGGGWASIIATGDPERPILALISGRFYDGALGEEVHFVRQARLLRKGPSGWQWHDFAKRSHTSIDDDHLRALCAGKADAAAADRAAGALQAACDQVQARDGAAAKAEARLAVRKKRPAGAAGGTAATDGDPQSIWLRDARAALAKGDFGQAIDTALLVDVVCGEAVGEAHSLIKDALAAQNVELQRPQPAQTLNDLCEPLPDKPAPKRPREAATKGKPDKPGSSGDPPP